MILNYILLIGWIIIGAYNLCSNREISKFSYFATWSLVVFHLTLKLVS